jgi:hypothetical protein
MLDMTRRRAVTTVCHPVRVIALLAVSVVCLTWVSPATAEDCGSPCTVTRAGLPTFRLVNTAGVDDWDLETSAFGVELAPASDSANVGAFRVEHGADSNTLVIDASGRVGIGTTVPAVSLQINSTIPTIRWNNTQAGGGQVDLAMFADNTFRLRGNSLQGIVGVDTRAPGGSVRILESGQIGIGTFSPSAKLHVAGDARVDGNVALGSSRTLKTAFDVVDATEVLAKLVDLPVAFWRYQTEDESARHIGPFAEDFQRLFGLGDGATISIVDAQGVAFAAIQGLEQRLAEKEVELDRLRSEKDAQIADLTERSTTQIAELAARLAAIEARVQLPRLAGFEGGARE